MCGIVGLVEWADPRATRTRAEAMLAALAHRGPDDEGLYLAPPPPRAGRADDPRPTAPPQVALGHRRSAVRNPGEAGHQPMPGADGLVWAVHDGNIYNHAELREELRRLGFRFRGTGDTEVLINSYLAWGTDCVARFNGMFAFAVYDARDRSLFLARDRFGVKPLYWYADSDRLLLAGEAAALLAHPDVPRRPDDAAAYRFLALGLSDCDERTFFDQVRSLPAGCRLRIRGLGEPVPPLPAPEIDSWYRPMIVPMPADVAEAQRTESFARAFGEAVRVRTDDVAPTGILYSDGPASALLAAMMHRSAERPAPRLFHYAADGAILRGPPPAGGPVVEVTGPAYPSADDFLRLVERQQEPFAFAGALSAPGLFAAAAADSKVLLAGLGAHAILGSAAADAGRACADHVAAAHWRAAWSEARILLRRGGGLSQLMGTLFSRAWRQGWTERSRPAWLASEFVRAHRGRCWPAHRLESSAHVAPAAAATPAPGGLTVTTAPTAPAAPHVPLGLLTDEALWRLGVAPIPALLRQLDRNAAAHSLEVRLPFLDHRLVELAAGLPVEDRIRNGRGLVILRRLPAAATVPVDVFDARPSPNPAAGFGALTPMLDDLFASAEVVNAGVFDARLLRRAWQACRAGRGPHGAAPLSWASYLLWRRRFVR